MRILSARDDSITARRPGRTLGKVTNRCVSVSRRIAAPPERIFSLLVDPGKHPLIDGSGSVKKLVGRTPTRLGLGSRFSMDMRMGIPYRMRNTVVEFEEGRRVAWSHVGNARWRWELSREDEATTLVTESFDWSKSPAAIVIERLGFPDRNRTGMEKSLDRLASLVGDTSPRMDGSAGEA